LLFSTPHGSAERGAAAQGPRAARHAPDARAAAVLARVAFRCLVNCEFYLSTKVARQIAWYSASVEYDLHSPLFLVGLPQDVHASGQKLAEMQGMSAGFVAKLFSRR
jgi:hypothetical protein